MERLRAVAAGDVVVDGRVAQALGPPEDDVLSGQETGILEGVARGLTNRQIGAEITPGPKARDTLDELIVSRFGQGPEGCPKFVQGLVEVGTSEPVVP